MIFVAPGVVEMGDVDEPVAGAGEVVIDVVSAGICGSELHGFRSVGMRRPPLVMGHEVAGRDPAGHPVVINPLFACGQCDRCAAGQPQVCRSRMLLGVHRPGGFAERVAVPESAVYPLPAGLDWGAAALIEPLANAVHAWRQVPAVAGSRVAIVGGGAIGLVCLLVAAQLGAAEITVADPSARRRDRAALLGAAVTTEALAGEYDVVVDAVGAAITRRASIERLRPAGVAVWLGLATTEAGFDGTDLVRGEKRVVGSFAYTPADFAEAVAAAGSLDLSWTTPVPLEQADRTFLALAGGETDIVRAVVRP
jgi:threonine dehydrogenase-like Zn-dependent dehydrogenase